MANVAFKRGLQANLDKMTSFVDGSFYLTSDTDRLYFAQSASELVLLNKVVQVVANQTALSKITPVKDGDFAYVEDGNILCVYREKSATDKKWVQINPDTNTNDDTYITGVSGTPTVTANTDGITISYKLAQKRVDKNGADTSLRSDAPAEIPVSFTISADDLTKATTNVAVGVAAEAGPNNNSVVIKTESDQDSSGAGAAKVVIEGKGGIIASQKAGNNEFETVIELESIAPQMTSKAGNTSITSTYTDTKGQTHEQGKVTFEAGTAISVTGAEADKIKISHSDVTTTKTTNAQATLSDTNATNVVSGVTVSAQGHVTAVETTPIVIPKRITKIGVNATDKSKLELIDSAGNKITGEKVDLFYTIGDHTEQYKNQSALPVYTKDEINTKITAINDELKQLNAMTYMGTVGDKANGDTVTTLPASGVKIGDTYKVNKDGNYASFENCKVGDLLIATGTENDKGIIPDNKVVWTRIESGEAADTTYTFTATENNLVLTPSTAAGDASKQMKISVSGDTAVSLVASENGLKATHSKTNPKTEAATQTDAQKKLAASGKFTVVDAVSFNEFGHITGVTTKEYQLPADNNTTYSFEGDATAKSVSLKSSTGNTDNKIIYAAGTDLTVAVAPSDTKKSSTVTYTHSTHAGTKTDDDKTGSALAESGTFEAVSGLTLSNGHIDGYTVSKYKLPAVKHTFSSDAAANNKVKFKLTAPAGAAAGSAELSSSSLTIAGAANKPTIDLVWGSF